MPVGRPAVLTLLGCMVSDGMIILWVRWLRKRRPSHNGMKRDVLATVIRVTGSTFAAAILALPAAAQTIVDGDTITVRGTTYRLYGIDAAEKEQHCTDGWAAGRAAISYLRGLVQDHEVACEVGSQES